MTREITVDERSFELAEHFLADEPHTEDEAMQLALAIQQAVEDWFYDREQEKIANGQFGVGA